MAGGKFEKGRSGNPLGRRPGTRCRATLAAEALLAGEARALTRKAVELALQGDVQALRLCLDRIVPPRKATVRLDVPPISAPSDIPTALAAVLCAVGRGDITIDQAAGLAAVIETARRAIETELLERRLAALEAHHEPPA